MSIESLFKLIRDYKDGSEEQSSAMRVIRSDINRIFNSRDYDKLPKKLINDEDNLREFLVYVGFDTYKASSMIDSMNAEETDNELAKAYERYDILLLQGPPGSGKNHEARKIHNAVNPNAPFIEINVATLDYNLIASELFGHEKGAFTGATETTEGAFVAAGNGTVFLDEIEDMPLELQSKLNTVLETGMIRKVGSSKSSKTFAKVIVASNRDLKEMVENKEFRLDLYTRLSSGYVKNMGSTRDRPDDVLRIASDIIDKLSDDNDIDIGISQEAIGMLQKIDLKGNFRDLTAILKRAFYAAMDSNDRTITPEHLEHESIDEESMVNKIDRYFEYDDETMRYLGNAIKRLAVDEDEIEGVVGQFPFTKVLLDRVEQVYHNMGGQKDIKSWLQRGNMGALRQYVESVNDLSTKTIKHLLTQMLNSYAITGNNLVDGLDSIVESTDKDEFTSLIPGENEEEKLDTRIMEVMDTSIIIADEDILDISTHM